RRHSYDPKDVWLNYDKPTLLIYGEKDWIVPHAQNVETIKEYFTGKEELLKTVVAYDAEHGMSVNSKWENLGGGHSYRRFYRISPYLQIEIVDFLMENGFAN
ncbi:MAG: alpha/beta fold hydrolase, partial [Bacteroidota bacterium]